MENFNEELAEIFEVDSVETNQILEEFECWDSLTILSIIALVDETYSITLSAAEITNAETIGGLLTLINTKKS
jgi:acyl carrier protein